MIFPARRAPFAAAIVPWNFPLLLTCWKLGPALAAGNSVILKPSEKSPLSAIRLAGLAKEAGLPDGVLNVVTGFGHEAGQALSRHNDIDAIAFTGSTRTGKQLLKDAGDSNMKRVWLEAGQREPIIFRANQVLLAQLTTTQQTIFWRQVDGGHDALCWRGGLTAGLIQLWQPLLSHP